MSNTFVIETKIELNHLGTGWEDAYMKFTPFTWNENKKLTEFKTKAGQLNATLDDQKYLDLTEEMSTAIMDLLTSHLIEGKGWNGKKLIDITKENFGDLPVNVIRKVISELQGEIVNPKG